MGPRPFGLRSFFDVLAFPPVVPPGWSTLGFLMCAPGSHSLFLLFSVCARLWCLPLSYYSRVPICTRISPLLKLLYYAVVNDLPWWWTSRSQDALEGLACQDHRSCVDRARPGANRANVHGIALQECTGQGSALHTEATGVNRLRFVINSGDLV